MSTINPTFADMAVKLYDERLKAFKILGASIPERKPITRVDITSDKVKASHELAAITMVRVIDDQSSGLKTTKQAPPKFHSGSLQQQQDKIRASYELMGVFS